MAPLSNMSDMEEKSSEKVEGLSGGGAEAESLVTAVGASGCFDGELSPIGATPEARPSAFSELSGAVFGDGALLS